MSVKRSINTLFILGLIISVTSLGFLFKNKSKAEPVHITLEQLAEFDGKDGSPLYVAVDGIIYDLTKCRYWKGGVHDKSPEDALGGRDMSAIIKKSTHGMKRVKRYPIVGYIVENEGDISPLAE